MSERIAVVGLACRYPDAPSPAALWESVVARRRAFRRLPAQRVSAADYHDADRAAPDRTYAWQAAVLEGWVFDRIRFRIGLDSFNSTDIAHWLALDVAADALADAGFADGEGLPRARTRVVVGNTLTGEISRATLLRLRWPYVQRQVAAQLARAGMPVGQQRALLGELEAAFKQPFPLIGDESLAGALANTIAGRICNHFDLQGGGFIVDGACCSSLLAVAEGCASLAAGDIDVAIVGGVDISLDPFELIGFAKAGALAADEMRVYDRRSNGFIPGEGCGLAVLLREGDAHARKLRVRAFIDGWGISSDGAGSITRPTSHGQRHAIERAYARAGWGIDSVALFEGHGTGTTVGDAIELGVLGEQRRRAGAREPAAIGSVKANIGHTKAAAGIAGFIKAALALEQQLIPPATGCDEPHDLLRAPNAALRVLSTVEPWPATVPLRAGVSAFGFGGINVHVAISGDERRRAPRRTLSAHEKKLARTPQSHELFVFDGDDADELRRNVARLASRVDELAQSELGDVAVGLYQRAGRRRFRAAVVASTGRDLASRLKALGEAIEHGESPHMDAARGTFLGIVSPGVPRVALLFPGQGAPARRDGGAWARRFDTVAELYASDDLPAGAADATEFAQPAIVRASLAASVLLDELDVRADFVIGHSLGEVSALAYAGVVDRASAMALVRERGRLMAERGTAGGAMLSIDASVVDVATILRGAAVVAALNGPRQTVVAGPADDIALVLQQAQSRAWNATKLGVSHAFHSPMMRDAAAAFAKTLHRWRFATPNTPVISTITGRQLSHHDDVASLLASQLEAPVRFAEAVAQLPADAALLIEAGPGHGLCAATSGWCPIPAVSLDASAPSLMGLLSTVAAAFVRGVPVRLGRLFEDRVLRPLDLERQFVFIANPCEDAPGQAAVTRTPANAPMAPPPSQATDRAARGDVLATVRAVLVARTALPSEAIADEHRLLEDLHLSSIAVAEVAGSIARALGVAAPRAMTDFADATVAQLAAAFERLESSAENAPAANDHPAGVGPWLREFATVLTPAPMIARSRQPDASGEWEVFGEDCAFLETLRRELESAGGRGVALVVGDRVDPDRLLAATVSACRLGDSGRFVLVATAAIGAAWARSLHLEHPGLFVRVVHAPPIPTAARWIADEAAAEGRRYAELVYDDEGNRSTPQWRALTAPAARVLPLDASDTVVATGGAKGIGAECARALAHATGAALLLLGRSDAADPEVAMTLRRLQDEGIRCRYLSVDVTDRERVAAALRDGGPIGAVLHAAGVNEPQALSRLDREMLARTIAVKLDGLDNVIEAIDCNRLKLLVTFGSIIAAAGLHGEAHYALANELLARRTEELARRHPRWRCRALQWSVWSGIGMGERLGRLEQLRAAGVDPLPKETAACRFVEVVSWPTAPTTMTLTGRFGSPPTVRLAGEALPLLRFLERPRLHVPGVELVADATVSVASDPYLADHVLDGSTLFPAVMALEALSQAAWALRGGSVPWLRDVEIRQPIFVAGDDAMTLRVAALADDDGVTVVLRSSTTGFAVDHVRARCQLDAPPETARVTPLEGRSLADADGELYGTILFQRGRFRRVAQYHALSPWGCDAELTVARTARWFADYLPQQLIAGDPSARDATMHALQACVPDRTLLPIGIERLIVRSAAAPHRIVARERRRDGRRFIYDVTVVDADGALVEEWQGLQVESMTAATRRPLPPVLLATVVERRLVESGVPGARVALAIDPVAARDVRRTHALRSLAHDGNGDGRRRRDDGALSLAHTEDWTLAVRGTGRIGCDLEPVVERPPATWQEMLGAAHAVANEIRRATGDGNDAAATRVWTAREALKKRGLDGAAPLHVAAIDDDGWLRLESGDSRCLSWLAATTRGATVALAFAWGADGKSI